MRVVWVDIDVMGHVNNATYFTYFETARVHYYMRLAGVTELTDFDLIVAKASCEFLRGLTFGEQIQVVVWVSHVGTTSWTFSYAILDEKGQWAARGETVQVSFDHAQGTKKPIPAPLRRKLLSEAKKGSGIPPPRLK